MNELTAALILTLIWTVVGFYVHLPALQDSSKELSDGAEVIALPTLLLVELKEIFTNHAYKEIEDE